MKKLFQILLFSIVLSIFAGCRSDLDSLVDGHHRSKRETTKPVMKTIRMSFGGDIITESDEPLLRAEDGDTYVGINVFWTEKDKEGAKEEKYAYGLFNNYTNVSIDLLTGYTYRFESTILIERNDKLWDHGNASYESPFRTESGDFAKSDMNKFHYSYLKDSDEQLSFVMMNSGMSYVATGSDMEYEYGEFHYPRVKRFYGKCDEFDPGVSSDVEIPMTYKSFGLKFILESIPENTSISVSDNTSIPNKTPETDPEYYLQFPENISLNLESEDSKSWECIFSLFDFSKNTQEFKLRFTWIKANGQEKSFSYPITVQAKKKKILKISIEGEVSQTKSGNITFTQMDDENMELEEDPEEIKKTFTK